MVFAPKNGLFRSRGSGINIPAVALLRGDITFPSHTDSVYCESLCSRSELQTAKMDSYDNKNSSTGNQGGDDSYGNQGSNDSYGNQGSNDNSGNQGSNDNYGNQGGNDNYGSQAGNNDNNNNNNQNTSSGGSGGGFMKNFEQNAGDSYVNQGT